MKHMLKLFGFIAIAAVIGFVMAGCENPTNGGGSGAGSKNLSGITVTTPPTKVQYNLNEEFDPAGMVVTALYSDGSTEAVTGYTTSGFSSTTAGNKTITVTYQGKTATFTITVVDPSKETAAKPVANPVAGAVASGTAITLSTTTTGAEIWYTTNGTTPAKDGSGSTKYATPIAITTAVTIKAIVVKEDMNDSAVLEAAYTIQALTPTNQTPVADDFTVGNLTQTVGNITAVTIAPKAGKSAGAITIYYNGSTTLPATAGAYPVTFDVAVATGFNAASGLSAGTLTINATNQTPIADDFTVGNLTQTVGSVTAVTITPKAGKSGGAITIYYNGSTTLPATAGTYPITFDVAAATGFNAASGLSAGTLTINAVNQTPVADDFTVGNLTQTAGSVTAVTITPKAGKSNGAITIYYNGSTSLPTTAGAYPVTFDVAAATGFNAATGLAAGTLTIVADHNTVGIQFTGFGDETIDLTKDTENDICIGESLTITVDGDFDTYHWYMNGLDYGYSYNNSYHLNITYLNLGSHISTGINTITAVVTKNDVPYSKAVTFRVVN